MTLSYYLNRFSLGCSLPSLSLQIFQWCPNPHCKSIHFAADLSLFFFPSSFSSIRNFLRQLGLHIMFPKYDIVIGAWSLVPQMRPLFIYFICSCYLFLFLATNSLCFPNHQHLLRVEISLAGMHTVIWIYLPWKILNFNSRVSKWACWLEVMRT